MKFIRYRYFISGLIILVFLVNSCYAVEQVNFNRTTNFNVITPDYLTISSIYLNNIDFNSNQIIYLNSYNQTYVLEIISGGGWGWHNFDINLTYPNGTVETKQLSSFRPFAQDYDVKIQYYWIEMDTLLDVDVYVGINPYRVELDNVLGVYDFPVESYITFNRVEGSSTKEMDVEVFLVTEEEYNQMRSSPLPAFQHAAQQFFDWSWNMILTFVSKIPYVGVYLEASLQISAMFIDNAFFYFRLFFIENLELTILIIESFIIGDAIISTHSFMALIKKLVTNHIAVIRFINEMVLLAIRMVVEIIKAVASVVNAIKPI